MHEIFCGVVMEIWGDTTEFFLFNETSNKKENISGRTKSILGRCSEEEFIY